jgi:hypothetical protein
MEIDGLIDATECDNRCVTSHPPSGSDRTSQVSHELLAATTNGSLRNGTDWQGIRKVKHD